MIATLKNRYSQAESIPREVIEFIEWLSEDHPHRCIQPDETLAQGMHRSGRRSMIDDGMIYILKNHLSVKGAA